MSETRTEFESQPDQQASVSAGWMLMAAFAIGKLLLHLGTLLWGGYGYFRDELYYLASTNHLSWGYVDHPPFSIGLLAINRFAFGDSLIALRWLPAVATAGALVIAGLLAREMGGGRFAQALAMLASLVSLYYLAVGGVFSMNSFDVLFWALAALIMVRLMKGGGPKEWVLLGLVLGLGLFNKVGVLWLGAGISVAILATPLRRWLRTRWPWMAAGLALLLFLPYVAWNVLHDMAHLEFIHNAVSGKYAGLTVTDFLGGQVQIQNPSTMIVWLAGLFFLLFAQKGRPFRGLAWIYLVAMTVLLINGQSKAEYLSASYTMLFAAGGVALESWTASGGWRRLRPVILGAVALGAGLIPLVLPVLPVETFVRYQAALGQAPTSSEDKELAALPQFYADRFGWEEKARAVAMAYETLNPEDRARVVIYASNYGRAGAIDFFGKSLGLPPAVSSHNSYWLWSEPDWDGQVAIILGGRQEPLEDIYEAVEQVAVALCDYCMPYEKDLPVFVVRRSRVPTAELWARARNYD